MKYLIELEKTRILKSTRDGFGEGLLELGQQNESVLALCADLSESTRIEPFAEKYPDRFVEVGVAEQNMAGIATGLSFEGFIPFMSSYAVFSPGRNWDQIRVSICYSKANVKIVGAHAGISVGPDGATHQALEDIAITRVLPNMSVVVPADAIEAKKATLAVAKINGSVYLRIGREKSPVITTEQTPFHFGKAQKIIAGTDVTIIACGSMVATAILAAEKLAEEISVAVINMHTIKPIDEAAILEAAKVTGAIVTAEEHQQIGGLGSAVAEVVSENSPCPVIKVGVPDTFGESGEPKQLIDHYGLSLNDIVQAVKKAKRLKDAS